jgi:hypothetical protein
VRADVRYSLWESCGAAQYPSLAPANAGKIRSPWSIYSDVVKTIKNSIGPPNNILPLDRYEWPIFPYFNEAKVYQFRQVIRIEGR